MLFIKCVMCGNNKIQLPTAQLSGNYFCEECKYDGEILPHYYTEEYQNKIKRSDDIIIIKNYIKNIKKELENIKSWNETIKANGGDKYVSINKSLIKIENHIEEINKRLD